MPPPSTGARWRRDLVVAAVSVGVTLAVVYGAGIGPGDDDDGPERDGSATATTADEGTSTTAAESDAPDEPAQTFEDGLHVVGRDVEPGRYIAVNLNGRCDWARLADVEGTQAIAAGTDVAGQAIVDIDAGDAAFRSANCALWERYTPRSTPLVTTMGDGDWVIGDQVEPGTYQSNVADAALCTWTHADGFTHTAAEVIDSHSGGLYLGTDPPVVVELQAGQRFSSQQCRPWARVE